MSLRSSFTHLLMAGLLLVLCLGAVLLAQTPAGVWTEVTPATSPLPRTLHGLAFVDNNKLLMFGGTDGGSTIYNDTWLYNINTNTWTNKAPVNPPGPRCRMGMAYIGDGKVLMYGGSPVLPRQGLNPAIETWLYDLPTNTWTKLTPIGAPPALDGQAMCYIGSDKAVMYGGRLVKQLLSRSDQTWIFDLSENKWTRKSANKTHPGARASSGMARLGGDQVLLFGGIVDFLQIDETWMYDRSDDQWTQLSPAVVPPARYGCAAAFMGDGQVMIYGGRADILPTNPDDPGSYVIFDDTWVFDLAANTWAEDAADPAPGMRQNPRLAESKLDGSGDAVLFGGNSDVALFGDTWTYDLIDAPAKRGALADAAPAPSAFALAQNYPNPFNPSTTIRFDLAEATAIRLAIYDVLGRVVVTLADDYRPAGQYSTTWNSIDDLGATVPAGIYFCKMTAGQFTQSIKLMLVK